MQTLLTAAQMHDADAYTIKHRAISSIDLMESAAKEFVKTFKKAIEDKQTHISILCGQGNNGGDGLAIARLLIKDKYENVKIFLVNFSAKQSDDYSTNLKELLKANIQTIPISKPDELSGLKTAVIIDAILGSGLNKPLSGHYADLAKLVNGLNVKVIAVDIPTGFNGEGEIAVPYDGIKADLVISFQRPKINFFFPESIVAMERFKIVNIGLDEEFIEKQPSYWKLTHKKDVKRSIQPRKNFSHKGTYGHALLVAGNYSTMGAALLAASACLHVGSGLTTVCLPQNGLTALNTLLPEVMAMPRNEYLAIEAFERFTTIAIGPGLGTEEENETLLTQLIDLNRPLLIDADGLTILSRNKTLLAQLPVQSILTPHMKEFDRLFGAHKNWWERVQTARVQAQEKNWIILLKNQYTFVCLPNGEVHINPTGNPAMASGGMGDVLTGIIAGLLAQSYSAANAAILGAYLHGKAGDELSAKNYIVTASQIALQIPHTIKKIIA